MSSRIGQLNVYELNYNPLQIKDLQGILRLPRCIWLICHGTKKDAETHHELQRLTMFN